MKRQTEMKTLILTSLLALLVLGCSKVNPTIEIDPGSIPFPEAKQDWASSQAEGFFPLQNSRPHEVLREGDSVKIQLWGETIISGNYTIGPDGFISVPLIGDIPATRTVRQELANTVEEHLQVYYDEPRLELSVADYTPRYAYVLGGVYQAGAVQVSPHDNLLTVIAKAGGIRERRNNRGESLGIPSSIRVLRGKEQMAVVETESLLSGSDYRSNFAVVPEDVIYIPETDTKAVSVLGEVESPQLVGLSPGLDATEAIALCGGLTEDARSSEVRVLRDWWSEEPQVIVFNTNKLARNKAQGPILLEDQDIIFVPRKDIATFNYYLRQITPSIVMIGSGGPGP